MGAAEAPPPPAEMMSARLLHHGKVARKITELSSGRQTSVQVCGSQQPSAQSGTSHIHLQSFLLAVLSENASHFHGESSESGKFRFYLFVTNTSRRPRPLTSPVCRYSAASLRKMSSFIISVEFIRLCDGFTSIGHHFLYFRSVALWLTFECRNRLVL